MSLICDGSSDLCLQDIISWMMDENFPDSAFQVIPAQEVIPARAPLQQRIQRVYELYKPDLILCHRDAEAAGLEGRLQEIREAGEASPVDVVAMVPVRMLESWLLVDERAIRCAANNKNGSTPLDLPSPNSIEGIADPKERLFSILAKATELPARRRKSFHVQQARSRVTSFMNSFAVLRQQRGFREFEHRFDEAITRLLS